MSGKCCSGGTSDTCIFGSYPTDSAYDANGGGSYTGMPPPVLTKSLAGDTLCTDAGENLGVVSEVKCRVGAMGLLPYKDVRTFVTTKDTAIKDNGLRTLDATGNVYSGSKQYANVCKAARTTPLVIDFGKIDSLMDAPISAMHKTWGNIRKGVRINGGVSKDNVSLGKEITVTQAPSWVTDGSTPVSPKTWTQKCLQLQVNGSLYSGDVPGLVQKHIKGQRCPVITVPTDSNPNEKVGAVIATAENLGCGRYDVIARAPDDMPDGKTPGYCFALWTFHYEEHYSDSDPQFVNKDNNSGANGVSAGQCFNSIECPPGVETFTEFEIECSDVKQTTPGTPGASDPTPKSCYDTNHECDTSLTVVNHEIDIEIPGSWPGKLSTQNNEDVWTTDTWNCNTFLGDNESDYVRGSWASQYVVTKLPPKGSTARQSFLSTDGMFHKYSIEWIVPKDTTKDPYVSWYFDDALIHTSYTNVPTRAGRFVVGGWFPHWVQRGNSSHPETLNAPFDTKVIEIASITFTPDANSQIVNYPQNYDQCSIPPIACGFVEPKAGEPVMDTRICDCGEDPDKPPPDTHTKKSSSSNWWGKLTKTEQIGVIVAGITIVILIIIVVVLVTISVSRGKKTVHSHIHHRK